MRWKIVILDALAGVVMVALALVQAVAAGRSPSHVYVVTPAVSVIAASS